MDFEQTLAQLRQWIGSDVNVQVLGLLLNVEGVLGQVAGCDGAPLETCFTLNADGGSFLSLDPENHERTIWVDNAQTTLLIEAAGVAVTISWRVLWTFAGA